MRRGRRGVGVAGLKKKQAMAARAKSAGKELEAVQLEAMKEQLVSFKDNLEKFARKHKKDINKDPVLRKKFHTMCKNIGVDPLASNKGFWAKILGVGDFYYETGIRIIEVCYGTKEKNGGMIEINTLVDHLNNTRPKKASVVSRDDVERSIDKLKILGSGFAVVKVGKHPNDSQFVQSVPLELNHDHFDVFMLAKNNGKGFLSVQDLAKELKWDEDRALFALEFLEQEGIAWIDDGGSARTWWLPSLVPGLLD